MLRESGQASNDGTDILAVTDNEKADPGRLAILQLVDATVANDDSAAAHQARQAIIEHLGVEALITTAGVIGNFEKMNRMADATGLTLDAGGMEYTADVRDRLDLDRFDTPTAGAS